MKTLPHIKIKELRILKGFSQQYIADKLGISQMAYSKIERNKTQLNWSKINRLAEILSINVWDLIDNEKETNSLNTDNKLYNENILLLKQLFHQHVCQIKMLKEEIKFLRKQLNLKQ